MRDILTIFVILLVLLLLISTLGGSIRVNENFEDASVEVHNIEVSTTPSIPIRQPEIVPSKPKELKEKNEIIDTQSERVSQPTQVVASPLTGIIEAFDNSVAYAAIS